MGKAGCAGVAAGHTFLVAGGTHRCREVLGGEARHADLAGVDLVAVVAVGGAGHAGVVHGPVESGEALGAVGVHVAEGAVGHGASLTVLVGHQSEACGAAGTGFIQAVGSHA